MSYTKRLLLGTALAVPFATNALGQNIEINESQLTGVSEECRTLAELVQDRTEPFASGRAEQIVAAINNDRSQECSTFSQRLQAGATSSESEQASDRATEEVQLEEEVTVQEEVTMEGAASVTIPDPNVDVEVPPPNVRVTEQHPQIDVRQDPVQIELRQNRPQIEVEIPEIVVRVEIPAPELYVLQANPQVRVSKSDPQVEVAQGEPVVTVTRGKPQLNVDIDLEEDPDARDSNQTQAESDTETADDGTTQRVGGDVQTTAKEPQVEIVAAEGQPVMTYESGDPALSYENAEPQVSVMMAERPTVEVNRSGEPTIIIETPEEREQRRRQHSENDRSENNQSEQSERQASVTADENASDSEQPERQASVDTDENAPEGSQSEAGRSRTIGVAELMDMEVVTRDGEELGAPEAFIEIDGQTHLVLESGGFLGIGEKQVPVPMSRVTMRGDRLILSSLTEDEIEAADDFDYDNDLELAEDRQVEIAQ